MSFTAEEGKHWTRKGREHTARNVLCHLRRSVVLETWGVGTPRKTISLLSASEVVTSTTWDPLTRLKRNDQKGKIMTQANIDARLSETFT